MLRHTVKYESAVEKKKIVMRCATRCYRHYRTYSHRNFKLQKRGLKWCFLGDLHRYVRNTVACGVISIFFTELLS